MVMEEELHPRMRDGSPAKLQVKQIKKEGKDAEMIIDKKKA